MTNNRKPVPKTDRDKYHPVRTENGCWDVHGAMLPACTEETAILYAAKNARTHDELEYLFWAFADLVWNKDPYERKMARQRWSHQMIHHAVREKYLAIGGAASAGKSWTIGGWAVFNFLLSPHNTIVLATSTDVKGAEKRIWGAIRKLMDMVEGAPVRVQSAEKSIRYEDNYGKLHPSGLFLITSDKSPSKDKVGKMIGVHADRVILIADELGDISHNVLTAATGNLAKNPHFQMIGMSNPASRMDPFGIFAMPSHGWGSVNTETDYGWKTKVGGYYLRLDAEDSPNFDEEDPSVPWETGKLFNFLPTRESLDADLDATMADSREAARKTRTYLRFNRAVFFDSDDDESYYSEADIRRAGADLPEVLQQAKTICGVDLSFSEGGDNTVLAFCDIGFDTRGQFSINLKELVYVQQDMTDKTTPRSLQISEKIRKECQKRGLTPDQVAIDASTGGGSALCDMLQLQWGEGFLRVQFGGSPSDKKIKNNSKLTGKDRYWNRAAELFFTARQYMLGRQIYGLNPTIIRQMCARKYESIKSSRGVLLKVEGKDKYRARMGHSPDETDAYLVAVELARTRFGVMAADPVPDSKAPTNMASWLRGKKFSENKYDPSRLGHDANLTWAG